MAGSGGKDALNMSLNLLHRARNLMFKDWLSPYSILLRKSTSSVPMSVNGRNVSTLGGISSSSSSAVTELISSSRRLSHLGARS